MTTPPAGDDGDVAATLARLEAALERIATGASAQNVMPAQASGATPQVSAMLVDRLDGIIARLRAELGE